MTLLLERLADNEQLLRALAVDELDADDVQAIQDGISDAEQGHIRSLGEFDKAFRSKHGFGSN